MELGEDSDEVVLPPVHPGTARGDADQAGLPPSRLSLDAFAKALLESGLLKAEEVDDLRDICEPPDAGCFARQLVDRGKLAPFQARVLLQGGEPPLSLDRYVILEELGCGGMGDVYKALHRQMNRIANLYLRALAAG